MVHTIYRLHRGLELEELLRRGRARDHPFFRVITRVNGCGHGRIMIVVAKKVAKRAVVRNRIRRRTREWLCRKLSLATLSLDIAIFFKTGSAAISRKQLYDALTVAAPFIY